MILTAMRKTSPNWFTAHKSSLAKLKTWWVTKSCSMKDGCTCCKTCDNSPDIKIVVVTEPNLMHCFDYRSSGTLDLLIARKLNYKRALDQIFGRLGRHTDNCKMFVIPALKGQEIDEDENMKHLNRVMKKCKLS